MAVDSFKCSWCQYETTVAGDECSHRLSTHMDWKRLVYEVSSVFQNRIFSGFLLSFYDVISSSQTNTVCGSETYE